jgi:hypothetical protein
VNFQAGQLVHIDGIRAHWGVIRVLWMHHPGAEDWMWASEMRLIEKGPSK